jgi:tetratricopeptide (TPR) repeat protein
LASEQVFHARCKQNLAAVPHTPDLRSATVSQPAWELLPDDPDGNLDFGIVLCLAGDYAKAAVRFESAAHARPDSGPVHYNLAMAYWHLRQYQKALQHARRAAENGVTEARWIIGTLNSSAPTRRQP